MGCAAASADATRGNPTFDKHTKTRCSESGAAASKRRRQQTERRSQLSRGHNVGARNLASASQQLLYCHCKCQSKHSEERGGPLQTQPGESNHHTHAVTQSAGQNQSPQPLLRRAARNRGLLVRNCAALERMTLRACSSYQQCIRRSASCCDDRARGDETCMQAVLTTGNTPQVCSSTSSSKPAG